MPEILLLTEVFHSFLGSGGGIFPICPRFCSQGQFFRIFWAMVVELFLYARNFAPKVSSSEFSGQWWWDFSLYAQNFTSDANSQDFSGQWWRDFSLYAQNYVLYGRFSKIFWHKNCAMALKCHRAAILFNYFFHLWLKGKLKVSPVYIFINVAEHTSCHKQLFCCHN